MGEVLKAG